MQSLPRTSLSHRAFADALPSIWPLFIFLQLMPQVFYDSRRFCVHKNKPGSEKTGHVPLSLSFFLNDCYHQAPSPDSTLALRWRVCRGMYSHEGPAQVDGCAAPVHGVIQDAEGEAGHFGLHQNAEVITCGANKRVSHQAPRRWESQGALRCRYPPRAMEHPCQGCRVKVNEGFCCRSPG